MNYQTHTLPNGIRLAHQYHESMIAHCGFMVNTGSRDESPDEAGMAHFIEHAVFKGTKKRKAYHIISRLEDVGGELNAYTTKEETCIHASFLYSEFDRTMELISDIMFHSTFPEREIEKEKEVIIDEINSYLDTPSEQIFDDFEEMVYGSSPLARPILGKPESIRSFKRDDIEKFMAANYNTDEMVVAVVSSLPFTKVIKIFEKYFGPVPGNPRSKERISFSPAHYKPEKKTVEHDNNQTHCIIGNIAYDLRDERRLSLHLLNNILGGPGMNSRLNLSLREKNGYTYNVEANYNPYIDSGIFCVYFGTDKQHLNKSIALAHREFKKMRETKLGTLQLSKAKKQLLGQLAIGAENKESLMLSMAKSMLVYNKVEGLDEISQKIEDITAFHLQEVANEILDPGELSKLVFV